MQEPTLDSSLQAAIAAARAMPGGETPEGLTRNLAMTVVSLTAANSQAQTATLASAGKATPWVTQWSSAYQVSLSDEAQAALCAQLVRAPYPDFRKEMAPLVQAVQAYEEALETGAVDDAWKAVLTTLQPAEAALHKDAHAAAVRASGRATPANLVPLPPVTQALNKTFAQVAQQAVHSAMLQAVEAAASVVDVRLGPDNQVSPAVRALKSAV